MDKISLFTILWITYQNVLNANGLQKYSPKFGCFPKSKDLPQFIGERNQ